jgi:hypothetical protein
MLLLIEGSTLWSSSSNLTMLSYPLSIAVVNAWFSFAAGLTARFRRRVRVGSTLIRMYKNRMSITF